MLAVLLLALTHVSSADGVPTSASWLWYPESVVTEGAGQTRYFRKRLDLAGPVVEARVRMLADDSSAFWVNGEPAPSPLAGGAGDGGGAVFDLAARLGPGENILAFTVTNAIGMGGLIVTGAVREADGRVTEVRSDPSFRVSREPAEGWDRPGFDDSAWAAAAIVGSAFARPWYQHPAFDLEPFLEPGDHERWAAWQEAMTALPEGLDAAPPAVARFGSVKGSCALLIDGKPRPPFIYRGTVDPFTDHGRRQIANFRDAGVHVYAVDVPLADYWRGVDEPNTAAVDDRIRAYLSVDPDAYLILFGSLVPPREWMDAHPDELVRYAQGDDYDTHDECGRVQRPSLASPVWRDDALAMWRAAIRRLENRPWGKRVIGYHPCFGIYGEWHYYGSWTEQMPDTGPAMTAHFRAWLRERYAAVERLREAWGDPDATFETAEVPGVQPRLAAGPLGLRDPIAGRRVMDYYECQQEITADDIELFCRAAKEETGGRTLSGVFYGYFNGVPPQTQGGHLCLERLLQSPYLDYFSAPYDYSHRPTGDDGRLRAICDAFPLAGKVHMIEEDSRTHLHPIDEYGRVSEADQSIAGIRRQVATALTHGAALWWCDFGADGSGGWYDDPRLMAEIARLMDLAEERLQTPRRRTAQVALICDLRSCYWFGDGGAMRTHYRLVDAVTTELYRTGAPFDTMLLSQLPQADLNRYWLLIFLNPVRVDEEQRQQVRRALEGRAALWLWAPGITDGERFGPDLVQDLTGFRVGLSGDGVPTGSVVCASEHALTAALPVTQAWSLEPTDETPVPEALRTDCWYNPRDEKTMREQYPRFEWEADADGLRWDFATTAGWTDIHLDATIPGCDGLSLTVSGEGASVGLGLRLVVKAGQGGEFVAPGRSVGSAPQALVLPFAEFTKAPWDGSEAARITFPLAGLKLVLDGLGGSREGTLHVSRLRRVRGKLQQHDARGYAVPGGASPVLTIRDPAATVLARDTASGEVVLACTGKGRSLRVLSTVPYVPRELLTAVMAEAGVTRYADSPDAIVRADSGLISLHTATGGRYNLRLPHAAVLTDALTGQALGRGRTIPLELPPNSTSLLHTTRD